MSRHLDSRIVGPDMVVESPSPGVESVHRIRRLLRVLRLVAAHMAVDLRPSAAAAAHLVARIGAIGRVALTAEPMGVDLESLVRSELSVHAVHRIGIDVSGPDVLLNSNCAMLLSLAVHELTTNAVKFGALSQPNARLTIAWRVEGPGASRLVFDWREEGMSMDVNGRRTPGFGTELLQRLIASELHGDGKMLFSVSGLRCIIVIPTSEALLLNE